MKKITLIISTIALSTLVSCSKDELTSNTNNNTTNYDCVAVQKELTKKLDSVKTMGEKITILESYRKMYPKCNL